MGGRWDRRFDCVSWCVWECRGECRGVHACRRCSLCVAGLNTTAISSRGERVGVVIGGITRMMNSIFERRHSLGGTKTA